MSYVLNFKFEYSKILLPIFFLKNVYKRLLFTELHLEDALRTFFSKFRYRNYKLEQNFLLQFYQALHSQTYALNFYDSKSVPNGQEKLLVDDVLKIYFLGAYVFRLHHVRPACNLDKKSTLNCNIRNTMNLHVKFAMTAHVVLIDSL